MTLFLSKLLRIIAKIITAPPINTLKGGISFKNNHTHKGPQSVSININKPTVAEAVVREPMVIQIKPKANCGTPNKNPMNMSCKVNTNDSAKKNPYIKLKIPE